MKHYLIILTLAFTLFRCSTSEKQNHVDYIKVLSFSEPDAVTVYNKGIGLGEFIYYEPANDSFVCREINASLDSNTSQYIKYYETFTAKVNKTHLADSVFSLAKALSVYKNGVIRDLDTSFKGINCSTTFYVEYKDVSGIHYFYFRDGNTALNSFNRFLYDIQQTSLKKEYVNNRIINDEKESVTAVIRLGEYDKMEEPYIPKICDPVIEPTKIFGSWRSIGKGFNDKGNFRKLTFTTKGTCFFEKVRDGVTEQKLQVNRFYVNGKTQTLIVNTNEKTFKFPLLKLTDSCLIMKDRRYEVRYDRL